MFKDILKRPCAEVIPVPQFSDNYAYIVVDPSRRSSFCIDPAEPRKILTAGSKTRVVPSAVFCTHKHSDHSGGNIEMARQIPDIPVYGSSYEQVPGVTKGLVDGEVLRIGNLDVKCIRAPCHTIGHMMYYVSNPADPTTQPLLFTGDTLFIAGCGRFFEGDAAMMLDIMKKIRELPKDTLIYCGHEYTMRNLEFASTVDNSDAVQRKIKWVERVRSHDLPTVPSTLADELEYNPFMRTEILMEKLGESTEEATMRKLRSMKDNF
ncbi:hydroxyacylglutathione hydrolase [Babesia ovis]|uniref:hydroxyacylglutathione hydrolase n=1 Tax=Babesia ovis TaxID=5869 RepID=A0A9W5T9E1_BABOV|nr:hydroxyacylglutathione hydrolase [Babesia ovis]